MSLLGTSRLTEAMPQVSTTHVTMGGIFGVGAQRREGTNWSLVQQIVLAWVVTLPLGMACALGFYSLLRTLG